MDAVSGIASIIALVQALSALPRLTSKLRPFFQMEAEIAELINELTTLYALQQSIQNAAALLTDTACPITSPLHSSAAVEIAQKSLNDIIRDVQRLIDSCPKAKEHRGVPCRVKWVKKSRQVKQLLSKTTSLRLNLQLAMTELTSISSYAQGRMLAELRDISMSSSRMLSNMQESAPSLPTDGSRDGHAATAIDGQTLNKNAISMSTGVESASSSTEANSGRSSAHDVVYVTASVHAPRACMELGAGRCGISSAQRITPSWLRGVVGSLFLAHGTSLAPESGSCETDATVNTEVHLLYCFPCWLWSRAINLRVSASAVFGVAASLHLEIPRVVKRSDMLWHDIISGSLPRVKSTLSSRLYLPSDIDEDGRTFLLEAVAWKQYHIAMFFCRYWNMSVRSSEKRAIMMAQDILFMHHCSFMGFSTQNIDIRSLEALLVVARLDKERPRNLSSHYRAIVTARRLPPELIADKAALDTPDYWQRTPLHIACRAGNFRMVCALIRAGASLNKRDYRGDTPLLVAIRSCNFPCAAKLIQSHSDIECLTTVSDPYFYFSSAQDLIGSFRILQHLQASQFDVPRVVSYHNRTTLHWLSEVPGDAEMINYMVRRLVESGIDVNAPDLSGLTPVGFAIKKNNLRVLRALVSAGAKLEGKCAPHGENTLHIAAYYAVADTLRYLTELEICNIDTDAETVLRETPLDYWKTRMCGAEEDLPGDVQRPTRNDIACFVPFMRGIRDREIRADIDVLGSVLCSLENGEQAAARRGLDEFAASKERANKGYENNFTEKVRCQILQGSLGMAAHTVREMVEVQRQQMVLSPFIKQLSQYLAESSRANTRDS